VVTAILAFAAACASWASVLQSRKQIRASLEPDLQIVLMGGKGEKQLGMAIRNVGGATAKRLAFFATIGDRRKAGGSLGVGFLPPNHGAQVYFNFDASDLEDGDVSAVVLSFDRGEFAHGWSHLGGHKVFRSRVCRQHHEVTLGEVFDRFFSGISRDERFDIEWEWHVIPPEDMYRSRAELRERNEAQRN
jgi:hypothetical protein